MRIQMLQVLDRMGKDYLQNTTELKFLLGPVIAKNVEQQEQFYDLFDNYLEEIQQPLPQPPPPLPWYLKIPRWLWVILALLPLVVISYLIYTNLPGPDPIIHFKQEHSEKDPRIITMGDTAHFMNHCTNLSPDHQLHWEIINKDNTIFRDTLLNDSWHVPINKVGNSPNKRIKLSLLTPEGKTDSFETTFRIDCVHLPFNIKKDNWRDSLRVNEPAVFKLLDSTNHNYKYTWLINQDTQSITLDSFSHTFTDRGFYTLKLVLQLPEEKAYCQKVIEHPIVVSGKEEIAPLVEKPLLKEPDTSKAFFKMSWWSLLGLLGLWPIWLWYKWWQHRNQKANEKPIEELKQVFDAPDKPPYFIPFRPMTHHIRAGKELYEFANTLRQRQEGLRKELNVEKSLKATIEKGGFPNIQLDRATQPSEYLFLIDEQYRDSIQSRLFQYLVDFLEDKDVYVERYFYNKEPYSLWKKKEQEALSLQQVQRTHPYYRLVVMGNMHRWMSEAGKDAESLKTIYTQLISRWQQRTLITPIPPISWTYKEAGIFKWFSVFPADMNGINNAFSELQDVREEEEIIRSFDRWQKSQLESRKKEPDINYRKWRQFDELKNYLSAYPALQKWVFALAVHPYLSWELTLAIGHALESEGVEITFDNLLMISRIPWLQQGHFPPKLRLQMLKALDTETERIARQTVQEELRAVENLTKNSFVNFELQAGLAIQNFLLAPDNPEYQRAIHALTQGAKPTIGNSRFKELDQQIKKYQLAKGLSPEGLNTFLTKAIQMADSDEKPVANPLTKNALLISTIWISILIACLGINNTVTLYLMSFDPPTEKLVQTTIEEDKHWFVKAHFSPPDDAAVLNNMAVTLYKNQGTSDSIALLLKEAIDLRGGSYQLAKANLVKDHYNLGVKYYQDYFESFENQFLQNALNGFDGALINDSLFFDAIHGKGLVSWYQKDNSGAENFYTKIVELDSIYFDTLSLQPNLKTLLYPDTLNKSRVQRMEIKGVVGDSITGKPLNNVLITVGDSINVRTDINGRYSFSFSFSGSVALQLNYQKSGYYPQTKTYTFLFGNQLFIPPVKLLQRPVVTPPISDEDDLALQLYRRAIQFGLNGQNTDKILTLEEIYTKYPNSEQADDALLELGASYAQIGQLVKATDVLRLFINSYPNSDLYIQALLKLGSNYYNLGNLERSLFYYKAVFDKDPTSEEEKNALIAIENIYINVLGQPDQYLSFLETTRGDNITDTERDSIYFKVAEEQFANNNYEKSIERFSDYIQQFPLGRKILFAYLHRGDAYAVTKNYVKALPDYEFVIKIGNIPYNTEALRKAALITYNEFQDFEKAFDFYTQLESAWDDPATRLEAQIGALRSAYRTNNVKAVNRYADKVLKNSLAKDDDKAVANFYLGKIAFDQKNYEKALSAFNDVTKISNNEQTAESRYLLAYIYYIQRDLEIAQQLCINANKESADHPYWVAKSVLLLADIFAEKGDPTNAIAALEGLLESYTGDQDLIKEANDKLLEIKNSTQPTQSNPGTDFKEPEMVFVQGGAFTMGCTKEQEGDCDDDEKPAHEVKMKDFYIGKYEVTNEEFVVFLNAEGNQEEGGTTWVNLEGKYENVECGIQNIKGQFSVKPGQEKRPMIYVSWYGARAYAQWLKKTTGKNFRLPSEAEWEYAARGGLKSQGYKYAGSNNLDEVGWYVANSKSQTNAVGNKKANELGIHDMSGNVWEWTEDCWHKNYIDAPTNGTAWTDLNNGDCSLRVVRGGSWNYLEDYCRVSIRVRFNAEDWYFYTGFRVARY